MSDLTDIPAWMDCRTGSGNERKMTTPQKWQRKRDQEMSDIRECRRLLAKAKRKKAAEARRRRRERKRANTNTTG